MSRQTAADWLDDAAARLLDAKLWGGTEAEQWAQNARLCLLLAEFAQWQLRRLAGPAKATKRRPPSVSRVLAGGTGRPGGRIGLTENQGARLERALEAREE